MSFPSETGRLPTLEALEQELLARVETRPAPRYPRATLATAVMAFVVAVTALTPFGRALAERVADLIGIGDPPIREQQHPVGEPAVVVGFGEVEGQRFELIASSDPAYVRTIGGPGLCFDVDFPDTAGPNTGFCATEDALAAVRRDRITAMRTADRDGPVPGRPVLVGGLVDPEAARVSISSRTSEVTAEASIGRLTPELAERIGADSELSFYVAFLPANSRDLVANGFAADGRELGEVDVAEPGPPGPSPSPGR